MKYSNIVKLDPDGVHLLSWRGAGEVLPEASLPVAALSFGKVGCRSSVGTEWHLLAGSNFFYDTEIQHLIAHETRFWGKRPSIVFQRTQVSFKELANDGRFLEALSIWWEKPIKRGDIEALTTAILYLTSAGDDTVYLSWQGEREVLPSR